MHYFLVAPSLLKTLPEFEVVLFLAMATDPRRFFTSVGVRVEEEVDLTVALAPDMICLQ